MTTSTDLINRPLIRRIINSEPAKMIRYWIVKRLDKSDVCWAELVMWAEAQPEFWPPSNKATACMPGGKLNLENTDGCYCGKYSTNGRCREE